MQARGPLKEKFYRVVVEPLLKHLRQGLSPERLALSVAFAIALGVFPVFGTTTLLCALVAIVFRLNIPAMQLVNHLVFPLQIVLILPFIRLGEVLYGAAPLPLTLAQIAALVRSDYWHAIKFLASSLLQATTAWFIVAPLAVYCLYLLLTPIFRRLVSLKQS
jgi:uncharacterized protein (DUF2062 family)